MKHEEERNILHTTKIRKANWIGHILHRNCFLKHVIEGKRKGTRRQRRRGKQLRMTLEKREDSGN
jgi:hypothetical protein